MISHFFSDDNQKQKYLNQKQHEFIGKSKIVEREGSLGYSEYFQKKFN